MSRPVVRPPHRERRSGWSLLTAADEGVRAWRHGRWLTWILGVLLAALFGVPSVVDAMQVDHLVQDERAWVAAGGRVFVVTNDQAGGVSRATCEALVSLSGVDAAASLTRLADRVGLAQAPDANLPIVAAGEGIARLVNAPPLGGGVLLPSSIAGELHVHRGASLALVPAVGGSGNTVEGSAAGPEAVADSDRDVPAESLSVAAVADLSLLGDVFSSAVVVPVSATGLASTCFVRVGAGYVESYRAALPALLATDGFGAVVGDRLVAGSFSRNYSAEYRDRPLRNAPWAAGAVAAILWILVRWIRRGQDGLYATLGADWATRTVLRGVEWICTLLASQVVAAVGVIATLLALDADLHAVTGLVIRFAAISAATATVGAVAGTLVPLRSPLAALKDR